MGSLSRGCYRQIANPSQLGHLPRTHSVRLGDHLAIVDGFCERHRGLEDPLAPAILGPMSGFDGREYQARIDAMVIEGKDVHGEVRLVLSLGPASVLDAGCGTGRVTVELAMEGIEVVGVDVDASMLDEARRRGHGLEWIEADLSELELGRTFDVVLLAGNVPLFCPATKRDALVRACARHVAPGGALVAGFSLGRGYALHDFDDSWGAAGLSLEGRWSTWELDEFDDDSDYVLTLLRRSL